MLMIFPTAFDVGFHPKSQPTDGPAAGGVPVSGTPAPVPPIDIKDVVETGTHSGQDRDGSYQPEQTRFHLMQLSTVHAVEAESDGVVIKVIDAATDEEVRQIQSEDSHALSQRIREYQKTVLE